MCTPGYYVGRVIDVKDIVDEHYVVTELSRINIDHEMKKTSYVHEMVTGAQETLPRQIHLRIHLHGQRSPDHSP